MIQKHCLSAYLAYHLISVRNISSLSPVYHEQKTTAYVVSNAVSSCVHCLFLLVSSNHAFLHLHMRLLSILILDSDNMSYIISCRDIYTCGRNDIWDLNLVCFGCLGDHTQGMQLTRVYHLGILNIHGDILSFTRLHVCDTADLGFKKALLKSGLLLLVICRLAAISLSTTCNRFVVNKLSQAMRLVITNCCKISTDVLHLFGCLSCG